MADKDDIQWITVGGKHIPIGSGESKEEAIAKAFKDKERQIKASKSQANKLNGKATESDDVKPSTYKTVSEDKFSKAVAEAKNARSDADKWRVDVHTPQEYKEEGCKCYTNEYNSTVAVTKGGDIISVCKSGNDPTRGVGAKLLEQAVKNGGTKLDSFAGNHAFYTKNGFEPTSWTPFNPKYAPDGWDKSGCKQEPVVFYRYVGKNNVKYNGLSGLHKFLSETKPYEGDSGYDDAYAYRDSKIKK